MHKSEEKKEPSEQPSERAEPVPEPKPAEPAEEQQEPIAQQPKSAGKKPVSSTKKAPIRKRSALLPKPGKENFKPKSHTKAGSEQAILDMYWSRMMTKPAGAPVQKREELQTAKVAAGAGGEQTTAGNQKLRNRILQKIENAKKVRIEEKNPVNVPGMKRSKTPLRTGSTVPKLWQKRPTQKNGKLIIMVQEAQIQSPTSPTNCPPLGGPRMISTRNKIKASARSISPRREGSPMQHPADTTQLNITAAHYDCFDTASSAVETTYLSNRPSVTPISPIAVGDRSEKLFSPSIENMADMPLETGGETGRETITYNSLRDQLKDIAKELEEERKGGNKQDPQDSSRKPRRTREARKKKNLALGDSTMISVEKDTLLSPRDNPQPDKTSTQLLSVTVDDTTVSEETHANEPHWEKKPGRPSITDKAANSGKATDAVKKKLAVIAAKAGANCQSKAGNRRNQVVSRLASTKSKDTSSSSRRLIKDSSSRALLDTSQTKKPGTDQKDKDWVAKLHIARSYLNEMYSKAMYQLKETNREKKKPAAPAGKKRTLEHSATSRLELRKDAAKQEPGTKNAVQNRASHTAKQSAGAEPIETPFALAA